MNDLYEQTNTAIRIWISLLVCVMVSGIALLYIDLVKLIFNLAIQYRYELIGGILIGLVLAQVIRAVIRVIS